MIMCGWQGSGTEHFSKKRGFAKVYHNPKNLFNPKKKLGALRDFAREDTEFTMNSNRVEWEEYNQMMKNRYAEQTAAPERPNQSSNKTLLSNKPRHKPKAQEDEGVYGTVLGG